MPLLITLAKALVAALPAPAAFHVMRSLAGRAPPRPAVTPAQQQALDQATRLSYGPSLRNTAWSWGQGPLLVLVHGWGGRAAQLAPLALSTSRLGYRCVAIDITGHGDSAGQRTGWRHFVDDVAEVPRMLGLNVHAYVGHSAGGLALMAARAIHGLRAQRYVCVCAPSHPYPPVRAVQQRLNPSPALMQRYQEFLASQLGTDWHRLEAGHAFANAGAELLLVYDQGDRFVEHTEGDRILAWCPAAHLLKPTSCGHTRVLASPELAQAVSEFLVSPGGSSLHAVAMRSAGEWGEVASAGMN